MEVIPPSDVAVVWHVFRARMRALWNGIAHASWRTRLGYALLTALSGVYLFAYAGVVVSKSRENPSSFLVWCFGEVFFFVQLYVLSEAVRELGRDDVLFSLPISRRALFAVKFVDLAGSLTRLYVLLAPLFVGAAMALRPTPERWGLYFLSGALTWAFVTGIGMAFAAGWYRLLPRSRHVGVFRWLSALGVFGVLVSFTFLGREGRDTGEILFEGSPPRWFSFLPTVWMYRALEAEGRGVVGLVLGSGVSVFLAWAAFWRWFDVERFFSAKSPSGHSSRSRFLVSRSSWTALVLKEWRILVRNPISLASLAISVGAWAWLMWLSGRPSSSMTRMSTVGLFGAFFVGIPRVGAEGERIALLRVVLPGMVRLLLAKAALTGALLLPMMVVSAVDWPERSLSAQDAFVALSLTTGYATFSVGIGAVVPHFHAEKAMGSVRLPAVFAFSLYSATTVVLSEVGKGFLWLSAAVGVATLLEGARRLARRDIV